MEFAERLRHERVRLGLTQAQLGTAGGVSLNSQNDYESSTKDRLPKADYLIAIAKVGVDIGFVVTGKRSSSDLPADEQQWLELFRSTSEQERAMFLRMFAAAVGAPAQAAKAAELLPAEPVLRQMFRAMLAGVDPTEDKDKMAAYLAEILPGSLELAEQPWDDAGAQQDDPHDEVPVRKRA